MVNGHRRGNGHSTWREPPEPTVARPIEGIPSDIARGLARLSAVALELAELLFASLIQLEALAKRFQISALETQARDVIRRGKRPPVVVA